MNHARPLPALATRCLRQARSVGWAGLVVWLWATAILPALHLDQHARAADVGLAPHRQRILSIIDEALGRAPARTPHPAQSHSHSHSDDPGRGDPHGSGALEHLGVVFSPVPIFLPPPALAAAESVAPVPLAPAPVLATLWLPRHPRGPPTADAR